MSELGKARLRLEVRREIVRENFRKIVAGAAPAQVFAVLKANAYGLGVDPIAQCLHEAGAVAFCVADLDEALHLRNSFPDKPIQILGSVFDFELQDAVANDLILGIPGLEAAQKISTESVRQNKITECHFKIDVGMGRVGILAQDALKIIPEILRLPNLNCCGIYAHFPSSERGENEENTAQIQRFLAVVDGMAAQGVSFRKVHMANSDGINHCPRTHQPPFTHVRAGIDLHGSFSGDNNNLGLEPVYTLKTHLAAHRMMPAGHGIGYNSTCILEKDTRIALIAGGYADGLPLALSNRGRVIINGRYCPVIGRVSMDYTSVSLEAFGDDELPQPGTEVTLIGREGDAVVTTEEWAALKGTHPYDILCSFGPRVKRIFI